MASKSKKKDTAWFCKECGYESLTYLGKCPACDSWSSFTEQPKIINKRESKLSVSPTSLFNESTSKATKLVDVQGGEPSNRVKTGFQELDNVLGGGIEKNSFILIGGDPGIGKSTLLLQSADKILSSGKRVLYVSAEESLNQIKARALRLNASQELMCLSETNIENVLAEVQNIHPEVLIIDSIQAVHFSDRDSFPGSPSQIRDCANFLMNLAKVSGISVIIVGHITKDGLIAGPKLLEHMVDVVLYFEGDKQNFFRMVRSIKNRFGPTDEIGLFEMDENGLQEVLDPSSLFLTQKDNAINNVGNVVTPILQGTRVILAEIQSLVSPTSYAQPKRLTNGLDFNRTNQIAAVLEKRIGLPLSKQDIYANVVGGLSIEETAVDLAICLSIASSARNIPIQESLIAIGEIGLSGEIRPTIKLDVRLKEAKRLGFNKALIPKHSKYTNDQGMSIFPISEISEAFSFAFPK